MRPRPMDYLGYGGFRLLEAVACRLGGRGALWVGEQLGRVTWRILSRRRELAADNVRRAFPSWNDDQVYTLVQKNFAHLARVAVEFASIPTLTQEKLRRLGRLENIEVLEEARSRGKGVLLLGGHFGNWEYSILVMAAYGYPVSAIAKRISNPLLDRHIDELRTRLGGQIIRHRNAVRPVLKALRRGEMVGFLLDQKARAREGVRSEFFGQPVSTNQGLALLALKSKAPVVFVGLERQEDAHVLRFGPIVDPPEAGDRAEAVEGFTREFDKVLEAAVRRCPEQWFWVHRRWRLPREMGP